MVVKTREKVTTRAKAYQRFEKIYRQLNRGQKKAVDTIEGPVMVMAGPGTGKTQVLAMRIANILRSTEMDPWNILCLTFTESGVTAMRERLISIIGTPGYYVRIHTFHSFCNEIIQEHPELFQWTRGIQVVSDIEQIMIFRSIVDSLPVKSPLKPFGNPYLYFREMTGNIQDLKQEDISPAQLKQTLKSLSAFVERVQNEAQLFFGIAPKERTGAACTAIHTRFMEAGQQAQLPEGVLALLAHLFANYQAAEEAADGTREASKARTAYKSELKKWLERTARNLPKQEAMATVYLKYQAELKKRGRYDYEDMIMTVVEELRGNDQLLAHYQEQFQYILVDEYQDTNGAQNDVVDLLGSFDTAPNLFVVGDDKQSIYRFQGASLANMLHFYERYKGSIEVVSLKENYRSQQFVLDAAQGVIAHNKESVAAYVPGVTQELAAVTARSPERVTAHAFDSPEAEDYFIATRARELIENGVAPSEIAVLYRSNRDGESLFRLLKRLGISARLEIGENILENHLITQWITLLTWLANGVSDEVLAQILFLPWWHLPAVPVLQAIHYAGSRYISLYGVLGNEQALMKAGVVEPTPLLDFAKQLASWRSEAANLPLTAFLEKLVVESHFLDHTMEDEMEAQALRKMTTLLNEAKQLNNANHAMKLDDFVSHLHLLVEHEVGLTAEPWQSRKQAVRLMTAHKAKGLEFEQVFIIRLNDRHWGNERDIAQAPLPAGLVKYDYVVAAENNEDERRLFYVALTRAKQHVYCTRSTHSATGRETVPAIFLQEIPANLVSHDTTQETDLEAMKRLSATLLSPLPHASRDDVRDYLTSLLDHYVMSVTHLNNYLECPRKFYFRNLLQVLSIKTPSLAMGSAVHEALYFLFHTINDTSRPPAKTAFIQAFEKAMQRELLSPTDTKHALEQGRELVGAYYDHYRSEFHNHSLLEYDFAGHGVHVGDLPLTGKIDKVEIVDAKRKLVNVVDYKTGNVDKGLKKLETDGDYFRQLVFYKLLGDASPRFGYTLASAEIDFVQASPKKGFIKKRLTVSDEEVKDLKETIARVWGEMKALRFLEPGAGCGKKECEYCKVI